MKKLVTIVTIAVLCTFLSASFIQAQNASSETQAFQYLSTQKGSKTMTLHYSASQMSPEAFASLQDFKHFQLAPELLLHDDFVGYHFVLSENKLSVEVRPGTLSSEVILAQLNAQAEKMQAPLAKAASFEK